MGLFRKTKRDPEPPAEQPATTQPQPDQEAKRRRRRRLLGGAYTGGWSGS
ncbi:hypothetical protein [Nocardia jejuensis]|nr:hypothetical protein [Nocardia jejuensis]